MGPKHVLLDTCTRTIQDALTIVVHEAACKVGCRSLEGRGRGEGTKYGGEQGEDTSLTQLHLVQHWERQKKMRVDERS